MWKPVLRADWVGPAAASEPVALPATRLTDRVAAAPGERVVSLDILRGLMALAVAVYHMAGWTRAFVESEARSAVILLGIYSVQGFFVISGYCFFALYRGRRFGWPELRDFHVRRFLRIAPVYYVAIALTYALGQPVLGELTPGRFLANLTLTFGLFHPNYSMVLGGWSIGVEYVFYLSFPILLLLTRTSWMLWVATLLLAACAAPITFGALQETAEPSRFNVYVAVANHAFLFMLGALIADARARSAVRLPWIVALGALAVLCAAAGDGDEPILFHTDMMAGATRLRYVALCTAAVALFAFTTKPWAILARPFVLLGDLSYSVYLMHPFAYWASSRLLPADALPRTQLLFALGATLLLAVSVHRLFERPAIELGRKLTRT